MSLPTSFRDDAAKLIAKYPDGQSRSALLPLLYLAQSHEGMVSAEAHGVIASLLGLTRAEVGAVSTFYTMYKRRTQGRWLVSVCTQPSCALAGGTELKERIESELGIHCGGECTSNGAVSVEDVECLCACDGAPVFSVNYENYEGMSVDDAVALVHSLATGGAPPPGARGEVPQEFGVVNRVLSGIEGPMPRARKEQA